MEQNTDRSELDLDHKSTLVVKHVIMSCTLQYAFTLVAMSHTSTNYSSCSKAHPVYQFKFTHAFQKLIPTYIRENVQGI